MSLSQIVLLNVAILLVGMGVAAFYWDKNHRLRWSPIVAALVAALLYLSLGPIPLTAMFVVKIVAGSLAVWLLMYFVVWIECREWRKKSTDR